MGTAGAWLLGTFNGAGILSAADVHVAQRLGVIGALELDMDAMIVGMILAEPGLEEGASW